MNESGEFSLSKSIDPDTFKKILYVFLTLGIIVISPTILHSILISFIYVISILVCAAAVKIVIMSPYFPNEELKSTGDIMMGYLVGMRDGVIHILTKKAMTTVVKKTAGEVISEAMSEKISEVLTG